MRKMSKAAKAEAYDELLAERDALDVALRCLVCEVAPDAVESVNGPEGCDEYEYRLYAASRANSGTLVHIFRSPHNKNAHVEAYPFEAWIKCIDAIPHDSGQNTAIKIACDRLKTARQKFYDKIK